MPDLPHCLGNLEELPRGSYVAKIVIAKHYDVAFCICAFLLFYIRLTLDYENKFFNYISFFVWSIEIIRENICKNLKPSRYRLLTSFVAHCSRSHRAWEHVSSIPLDHHHRVVRVHWVVNSQRIGTFRCVSGWGNAVPRNARFDNPRDSRSAWSSFILYTSLRERSREFIPMVISDASPRLQRLHPDKVIARCLRAIRYAVDIDEFLAKRFSGLSLFVLCQI